MTSIALSYLNLILLLCQFYFILLYFILFYCIWSMYLTYLFLSLSFCPSFPREEKEKHWCVREKHQLFAFCKCPDRARAQACSSVTCSDQNWVATLSACRTTASQLNHSGHCNCFVSWQRIAFLGSCVSCNFAIKFRHFIENSRKLGKYYLWLKIFKKTFF